MGLLNHLHVSILRPLGCRFLFRIRGIRRLPLAIAFDISRFFHRFLLFLSLCFIDLSVWTLFFLEARLSLCLLFLCVLPLCFPCAFPQNASLALAALFARVNINSLQMTHPPPRPCILENTYAIRSIPFSRVFCLFLPSECDWFRRLLNFLAD